MSDAKPAPTSHAHEIDPVNDGKLGEASKTLSDQYAKAKAAQVQKQAAAKEQQTPNMSFAKGADVPAKENKLDAASQNMGSQFQRAKSAQLGKEQDASAIKAPAPAAQMHLRPGGQLQKDVDRPIHNQQMSDYAKQVKGLQEAAKNRQNTGNQAEMQNGKGKDLDRGR